MNREEALTILRVDECALDHEVREALATRGNAVAGDRQEYERVLEAARVLGVIGVSEPSRAITLRANDGVALRRQSLELARLSRDERQLRSEEAEKEIQRITEVEIDPLRRARRLRTWFAGVTAAVGALGLLLRGVGAFYGAGEKGDTLLVTGAGVCVAIGALVGLFAAMNSLRIQELEGAFEDISTALSRRAAVAATFKEIIGASAGRDRAIAEGAIRVEIVEWLRRDSDRPIAQVRGRHPVSVQSRARRIGPDAFLRVLVSKGKEARIVSEEETLDSDGELQVAYRLRIEPLADPASERGPDDQVDPSDSSETQSEPR